MQPSLSLRQQSTWNRNASTEPKTDQFAFQTFVGKAASAPHGARTLADDGADANFISRKFASTHPKLQLIPLKTPIVCEGYNGLPEESITHRVEFYMRVDTHLERTGAYVLNTCGQFDLVLGFRWRRDHQPTCDYTKLWITFDHANCKSSCWMDPETVPIAVCEGALASPPRTPRPPAEDTPKKPETTAKEDIHHVSFRAAQAYASRKGHETYLVRLTPELLATFKADHQDLAQNGSHARRTAADSDYSKFFQPPEEVNLQDILSPSDFERYAEILPTFNKEAASRLPAHSEHDLEIKLKPGAVPPAHKMRPQQGKHAEIVEKYLARMLEMGFIEKCNSPVSNNLLIVAKPDGGLRVCVDYRDLNDATIKDRYPIPFFRETLARLNKARFFSKFDVIHAFHRLRMKKGSEWLTAFSTRLGTFQYLVMPFGLCNAPATFQRAINSALFEFLDDFCTAYLDDVLVYSETLEEHIVHVKAVLHRLGEKGFFVDAKKSEFHRQRIKFLGMIITDNGIEMDPEKVRAVQEWEMPTTAQQVLAFLGYTGFYRRFIKDYSHIALPLTKLVKATIVERPTKAGGTRKVTTYEKFTTSDEHERAFQSLKDAFKADIVLKHFDPSLPIHIFTDASAWATGGVMKQPDPDGSLRPIAFFSKKHTPAECNYDIYDLELMAIIRAFEEWEPELMGSGHCIDVTTDHRNLETFMTTKQLNRRQARWSLFLSQFNFKIAYTPGELNGEADALSRRPQDVPIGAEPRLSENERILFNPKVLAPGVLPAIETAIRCLSICQEGRPNRFTADQLDTLRFCLSHTTEDEFGLNPESADGGQDWVDGSLDPDVPPYDQDTRSTAVMLQDAYANCKIAQAAFTAIDEGHTKLSKLFKKEGHYFSRADISSTGTGIHRRLWLDKTRLYVPPDARLRHRIFELCHDHKLAGHKGPRPTFYLMYNRYYWPKMAQSIKKYCNACPTCTRTKSPRDGQHGFLRSMPIPNARWSDIAMDFIQDLPPSKYMGRTYRNLFVICCRLTKRRHFFATEGRSTLEAARCLMEAFKLHGLPTNIVSDRGTTFTSGVWRQLCSRLRIQLKMSTSFHPETDGQTERSNQSLETYLRQYVNFSQDNWAELLPFAEFQVNDTVNVSIGMTPFFADLGYHPKSGIHPGEDLGALTPYQTEQRAVADEILDANSDLVAHLKEQLLWAQQEQSAGANAQRHTAPAYSKDDLVWVSTVNWATTRPSKKFEDRWSGPYKVTRVIHDGRAYELDLPQSLLTNGVFPVFHPKLLRPHNNPPLLDQEPPFPVPITVMDENGTVQQEWYVDEVVDCKKHGSGPFKGKWMYTVKWTGDAKPGYEPANDEWMQKYDARLYHHLNPDKDKPPGFQFPTDWSPAAEDIPTGALPSQDSLDTEDFSGSDSDGGL